MAIKLFSTLMMFFALVLVFVSLQDFYFIDLKNYSLNFKSVEASNLKAYELNQSGVLGIYEASSWERFAESKKDVFDHFKAFKNDFNLSADTMSSQDMKISFEKNVFYEDVNQTRIYTDELDFDRHKQILSTQSDFRANRSGSVLRGKSLIYDLERKKLEIEGLKAWILE